MSNDQDIIWNKEHSVKNENGKILVVGSNYTLEKRLAMAERALLKINGLYNDDEPAALISSEYFSQIHKSFTA